MPCHTELEKRFADFLDGAIDVMRYFKNERFGFSVTYYESNHPLAILPDLIIAARDTDGRELMWLAETKGEIRRPKVTRAATSQSPPGRLHVLYISGGQIINA